MDYETNPLRFPSVHPIKQAIRAIVIDGFMDSNSHEEWIVGCGGVTRIEQCMKSGMHADLPYVRVWKGNVAVAEFCQHNIVGVYFNEAES